MSELAKTRRVIQPAEVLPPAIEGTYGAIQRRPVKNSATGEVLNSLASMPFVRDWNPYPHMRAMGYTKNPDVCRHGVKGYTPRDGWWCKECGENLKGV